MKQDKVLYMAVKTADKPKETSSKAVAFDQRPQFTNGHLTQRDLARLAGVSLTTVYNTLHKDLVHQETREKIHTLMKEYDYQPNGVARAMVRGKTEVLGVLVPRIDVRYFSEIVASIENSVNNSGYNCIICQHLDDMTKEEREIRMMRERRVDGMIIRASGRREDAEIYQRIVKSGIPVVLVDRKITGLEKYFVGMDGRRASYEMTEYLIRKGHKRIAVTAWPEMTNWLGIRFEGYRQALEWHNIEFDERLVAVCSNEYFTGHDETLEMMRRTEGQRPTAILALSDSSVPGVVQAFMELGVRIPDDMALATIGGQAEDVLGSLSRFRLTCALPPFEAIGREATRMLIDQIDGNRSWHHGPIYCPTQIRVGNSA